MEVVNDEGIKELVQDELAKLGIHDSPTLDAKKPGYGVKLLNRTGAGVGNKVARSKKKEYDSSKESPGVQESLKNNPKSPFSKNRNNAKKKSMLHQQSKVFGVGLSESPQANVTLPDGNCVQVPQFLADCCNLLRNHITLEGIFRKAGSASRQNEIKRLVDSGNYLPTNMHPIDAACLIKQFFRCLPRPLLEASVHARMLRCLMTLEEGEPRISGLTLCSLLLPSPSQHSLVYFLSFLDEVVQQSSSNRMDAYNLAVVLSPNLLPITLGSTGCHLALATAQGLKKNKQSPPAITDDNIIATNIDIVQELIRHQHRMCRLPSDVLAGLVQEQQLRANIPDQGADATDGQQIIAVPKSKKRRSASIHRLMSGLRRVVGAQSLPIPTLPNPNSPHPLHQHRITRPASPLVAALQRNPTTSSPLLLFSPSQPPLSLHPSGGDDKSEGKSPGKRKSDVLLPPEGGETDQPKKKARLTPASIVPTERRSSTRLSYAAAVASSPRMAPPQVTAGVAVAKVRRSATAREPSSGARLSFPRNPSLAALVDPSTLRSKRRSPNQRRSLNSNIGDKLGMGEKWVVKSEKLVSSDIIKSKNKPTLILYPYLDKEVLNIPVKANRNSNDNGVQTENGKDVQTNSNLCNRDRIPLLLCKSKSEVKTRSTDVKPPAPRTPLRTSKTDGLKFLTTPNLESMSRFSVTTPASGRRSEAALTPASGSGGFTPRQSSGRISKRARRKARNARLALQSEPDGEPASTPSRPTTRGQPDGAERTLRDSPAVVERPSSSGNNGCDLTTLESQYDTIKEAVAKMEKQINDDALDELKRSLFGDEEITSIATLNHNEIIQSAYDKMKKESNMLGMSPSENLSRRLDRELKIRRRRSGENCVVRSPSARKIGTIRRRSKELELKCHQGISSVLGHETPACSKSAGTPRLKEPLMKSPLTHSLKRGRPNSVRCGLPFVVRPIETEAPSASNETSVNRSNFSSSSSTVEIEQDIDTSMKVTERQNLDSRDVSSESKFSLSSPGNMDDHALPAVMPGVTLDCVFSSVDVDNEQWLAAADFLEVVESQVTANDTEGDDVTPAVKEKDGNRPSIAALKKQKKVTANVQLFNQLGCVTPGQQRRQSRSCKTPAGDCLALPRPAVSERRQQHRGLQQQRSRYSGRASLTPRHFSNSSALRYSRPRMVAVVSPLKENVVNVTPSSASKTCQDNFKTPGPPSMTPLSTRHKGPARVSGLVVDSDTKVKRESLF